MSIARFTRYGKLTACALTVFCTCVVFNAAFAQSPGGVNASLTSWLKANTSTAGNITIPVTANSKVSAWKSEVGSFTVNQTNTSYQPVFMPGVSATATFNFNPVVQFSTAATTSLYNSATATDLLGTSGTVFFICNNYPGSFGNPTGFTYYANSSYRYQIKPSFRMQVGANGAGYTSDINAAGGPTNTAPDEAAFILVSKSNESSFRGRKNADSIPLTNTNDAVYFPSISAGMFLGNDGTGGGGQPFNGAIAEVITYNSALSNADINKVETYLAIKYGVTLSQASTFGISNSNYTSSAGTQVWNAAANSAYGRNITGIARDDASGLLQKQARSVHTGAYLHLFNGNAAGVFPAMNTDNASSITSDQSFLLVGDNGASTTLNACLANNRMTRMGRTWKVQKTGTGISQVTIAVNITDISPNAKKLLVSADPTFATGTSFYTLSTAAGKLYAAVTLNNNEYFTFGSDSIQVTTTPAMPTCTNPGSGSINTTVSGGSQPYTYSWAPTGQTTASISNVPAGTYTLTVRQGNCNYIQQVIINPVVLPLLPVLTNTAVCSGSTATLAAANPQTGVVYNWYTTATGGSPVFSGISFTTPAINATNTWYVEAVGSGGCISASRTAVTVSLLTALAQPVVTTGTATVNSVTFNWQAVAGATGYSVSVNGGAAQVLPGGANTLSYTATGLQPVSTVTVQVTALGAQSCQNSVATATGKTLPAEIFIPNVFTPNNDGRNDDFRVYGNAITGIDLRIFNQWGELLWQGNDAGKGWDGSCKGKQQPVGVYVYAAKIVLTGGETLMRKGEINLVR